MGSAQQNAIRNEAAPAPPAVVPDEPRVPRGMRVYAIGDIHGRLDLLEIMHHAILEDAKTAAGLRKILIHLGDYIDRGPDSCGVVERLAQAPLEGFEVVNLKGNHENILLRFLDEKKGKPSILDVWYMNGCAETLLSYGVDIHGRTDWALEADDLREKFAAAIPESHMRFYRSLKLRQTVGDYLFVHAGINPDVPLRRQKKRDLLWIRDQFLNHAGPFGKIVVHGHTIFSTPEVHDHRIGIDTGAYYSHHLTCLVLEGTERHFLET